MWLSVSSSHRHVTGSVPDLVRRNSTRAPSGETVKLLGTPRVKRRVLAWRRGKLSLLGPILPVVTLGTMIDRRLLLVHAHPDDETIGTGATMARYVAEGAHVTLVTCTLGEEGEVIPEELAHLAATEDDVLGDHRIGELAAACAALGVEDHRFLGGPGRWRDSGMMGVASNDRPGAFWRADVDEAAGELVKVIREVRPQVLVTYDENGHYGHPDHIQAHRVSRRAFELAADPGFGEGEPWRIAKFYHTATPR